VPQSEHKIWARVAILVVDMARRAGLPIEALLEDLPFDEQALRRRLQVDWGDYCTMVERTETLAGGSTACRRLLEEQFYASTPELRAIVGSLVSPMWHARLIWEVVVPIMYPPVYTRLEVLGRFEFRLTQGIRDGARPCRAFLDGSVGALRGMPCQLGLPPAKVAVEALAPEEAVYHVQLPHVPALRQAMQRIFPSVRLLLGYLQDGTPVVSTIGGAPTDSLTDRVAAAGRQWNLTPHQCRVLVHIAKGLSNKEIAVALQCAEGTVELHVTHILRKAHVGSRTLLVARLLSET